MFELTITQAKCKRLKFLRGSSLEDSILVDQQTSWASSHGRGSVVLNNSSSLYQVEVDGYGSSNKLQHHCDSGRETPASSIITSQQPALHQSTVTIKSPQSHYYTDDSEMPAWKIYAKELYDWLLLDWLKNFNVIIQIHLETILDSFTAVLDYGDRLVSKEVILFCS